MSPLTSFPLLLSLLLSPLSLETRIPHPGWIAAALNAAPARQSDDAEVSEVESLIVKRTNRFREDHGRSTVQTNEALEDAARYFARYMARTGRYGHTADGKRPSQRAEDHGYEYCMVSENIAYQYSSVGFSSKELAQRFMEGWEQSKGHRENLLARGITDTGVAVAQGEGGRYYAVQMFGRHRSRRMEFIIRNRSGQTVEYELGDQTYRLSPRYTRTHRQCRRLDLVFLPGSDNSKTVRPQDGDRYVIHETDSGGIRIAEK
ncbi:MAG: hypothetical protein AMXMBFR13_13950 [Phycisphaerae bacterium]